MQAKDSAATAPSPPHNLQPRGQQSYFNPRARVFGVANAIALRAYYFATTLSLLQNEQANRELFPSSSGRPATIRSLLLKKAAFVLAILYCCSPWSSPPLALAVGLVFGLVGANPWTDATQLVSRQLLKISVVGLGFGMDLGSVLQTGKTSFVYTGLGIVGAMALGMLLGKTLRVPQNAAFLISAGTSICGGSAIAAVRSVVDANEEETAVSLTTVFVLNSIALLLFPIIGTVLGLSQRQFGLWAALAIHDTSSVVGAGLKYGPVALIVGTTVKLVRALWIVPLTLAAAAWFRTRAKTSWPWFILFFLLAAWLRSILPAQHGLFDRIAAVARIGFSVTLFLIGAGLSLPGLKRLGWRPLAQGIALWFIVATTSLFLIRSGWIAL